MIKKSNKGVTLVEILLACILMACAFIPIMGAMSSSFKITEKDKSTQIGIEICQRKINQVLKFPFHKFEAGNIDIKEEMKDVNGNEVFFNVGANNGKDTEMGIDYISTLSVAYEGVTFQNVELCDFNNKAADTRKENIPSWFKAPRNIEIPASKQKIKRYTVTTKWIDRGGKTPKFYTLSAIKADIRN